MGSSESVRPMGDITTAVELRRLFDAYDAAVAEYQKPLPVDEATFLKREEAVYAATGRLEGAFTRAIQRALLNVAEAAEARIRDACFSLDEPDEDCCYCKYADICRALAPLLTREDADG